MNLVLSYKRFSKSMPSSGVASSIIGGWGGGAYSYIRVHRSEKQSISKEINNAEHEYMNMPLPQLSSLLRH
jgi:hypothetical protein